MNRVEEAEQTVVAIGDIHGCYHALQDLLGALGCRRDASGWCVPSGQHLVFVGDLIDRGRHSREVVALVRELVEAGQASCLMGNHEFNAIAYRTEDPKCPGDYLRPRTDKNTGQFQDTLASYEGHDRALDSDIAWFERLPVALEIGGLRCVHASWDDASLAVMERRGAGWYLPACAMSEASTRGSALYEAVERLCKGPEAPMPNGGFYADTEGNPRRQARVAWWNQSPSTWAEYFRLPPATQGFDPQGRITPGQTGIPPYPADAPPIMFGHYWMTGTPAPLADNAACLDYSVVKGGRAVAYVHRSGACRIDPDAFVSVPARAKDRAQGRAG